MQIRAKVTRVFQHSEIVHVGGIGKDAIFDKKPMGWFVAFEGSYEALYAGETEPDLKAGDHVVIIVKKVDQE